MPQTFGHSLAHAERAHDIGTPGKAVFAGERPWTRVLGLLDGIFGEEVVDDGKADEQRSGKEGQAPP